MAKFISIVKKTIKILLNILLVFLEKKPTPIHFDFEKAKKEKYQRDKIRYHSMPKQGRIFDARFHTVADDRSDHD